jgi:hypothetical protein
LLETLNRAEVTPMRRATARNASMTTFLTLIDVNQQSREHTSESALLCN